MRRFGTREESAVFLFLCLVSGFLFPGSASAHSVGADAYVSDDGKSIVVDAWLGAGEVPSRGVVTVLGPGEQVVAEGKLVDGSWTFVPSEPYPFKFIVDLGYGHGKTFTLHPDELEKLKKAMAPPAGKKGSEDSAAPRAESGVKDSPSPRRASARAAGENRLFGALLGLVIIGELALFGWVFQARRELRALKDRLGEKE